MSRIRACAVAGVALGLLAPPVSAQETPIAFVGARVIPVAGPEIPRGVVVVHRGRIVAVGAEGRVPVPSDALRRDV
jgi:imidazolonepropionase-like amidohydrolase